MIQHILTRSLPWVGLTGAALHNLRRWQHDLALAEQLREASHAPLAPLARQPLVSALVAAWNEEVSIDAHIRSFLALGYPSIELIICAGGSDQTLERARCYESAQVIVLEQLAGEGKQGALARCYQYATGELIYLTDADCLFDAQALHALLAPLVNDGEQAASGRVILQLSQNAQALPFYIWATDLAATIGRPPYADGLLGRNSLIARAAIERSGGMHFDAPTGTDYHLARRLIAAAIPIRFVGQSAVETAYPTGLADYGRSQARWVRNLLIYGRQYKVKAHTRAALFSGGVGALMIAGLALQPALPPWLRWLWRILFAHALLARLRYAALARSFGVRIPQGYLAQLPLLTLADFAIWAVAIAQAYDRQARHRW